MISNLISEVGRNLESNRGHGAWPGASLDNCLPSEWGVAGSYLKSVCSDPQTPAWLVLACISCLPVPPPVDSEMSWVVERAVSRPERGKYSRVLSSPVQSGAVMRDAFFRTTADRPRDITISLQCLGKPVNAQKCS